MGNCFCIETTIANFIICFIETNHSQTKLMLMYNSSAIILQLARELGSSTFFSGETIANYKIFMTCFELIRIKVN